MRLVYYKMGRKRKADAADNDTPVEEEEEEAAVGGDSPPVVEAVGGDAPAPPDKKDSPPAASEGVGGSPPDEKESVMVVEATPATLEKDSLPPEAVTETVPVAEAVEGSQTTGDIPAAVEGIAMVEVVGEGESYMGQDFTVVVEAVGDGKSADGVRVEETSEAGTDFAVGVHSDSFNSPQKESLVLAVVDAHTPNDNNLLALECHGDAMDTDYKMIDVTPAVDQEEPRDSSARGGLDRTALRCHEHTLKLEEWKLTRKQKELVCKAGFGHFIKIGPFTLDKQQITALVERWNKETNTFHLPVGEMTITLDEVVLNLGLAIDGDPVVAVSGKDQSIGQMCLKYLGKIPTLGDRKGGFLKLGWLKDSFSECPEDAPMEKVELYTRAYLLYLVGSTIFSTTTGNTVPVLYLPLFEDLDRAGKYAWGAAALAFLYRSLSNASSRAQNTISGCLTLLQCWSYLHLDIRRPRLSEKASNDLFPLALRWKQKQSGHRTKWSVLQYQKALDALQPYDVEWLPYKNIGDVVPEDINASLILGKSKTTLLCLDKAEKHNPDRCLRQFGMPQPIPENVLVLKESDGEIRPPESKDLSRGEWFERRERIVEEDYGVGDEEYAEWYSKFSRNVRRKTSLEDVYQQTVVGLTKMLELSQTLTRDDMPTKNKEVVRNIINTLSEGLRKVIACKGKATGRQLEMLANY